MLLFVAILVSVGNRIVQQASEQQVTLRDNVVQPLLGINGLQSQLYRIRVTEVNLQQQNDFFALSATVSELSEQIEKFNRLWSVFSANLGSQHRRKIHNIERTWLRLVNSLQMIMEAASENDHSTILKISQYESQPRFNSLSKDLQAFALQIKATSDEVYRSSLIELEFSRKQFLVISGCGLLLSVLLLMLFARYLSRRVNYLQHSFMQIAEGRMNEPVDESGNDELTALAISFNALQQKVANREIALNQARIDLEDRVVDRTKALEEANSKLIEEVDERRKVEHDLRILSLAVSQSPVGVFITDALGVIEYANKAFLDGTGFSTRELYGKSADLFVLPDQTSQGAECSFSQALKRGVEWSGEVCCRKKNGEPYWEFVRISLVKDKLGNLAHYLIIKEDITERRHYEQKLLHQAHYDSLTQLPNRTLGMERLGQGVILAKRHDHHLAVMFIDLDGFKNVNDSLGHAVGDELLVLASSRLLDSVRESDVVCRLGGDEFLIIMSYLNGQEDCFPVLKKIKNSFSEPFRLEGHDLIVTPSIGLSLFPEDGSDGPVLLRNADLAMYQAKEAGRNTYCFFNREIHENLRTRMKVESLLKGALENEEFYLLYQPIIEAKTHRIVGVEALLRWENSELGRVMPDLFIGIAEQTGLIVPIGNWVLRNACNQVASWQARGLGELSLAVNVSPRQIQEEHLNDKISESLQLSGLPAHSLILEMTEGLLIRNPNEARNILESLKDQGVGLAMDDFGTGYSSLSNLKNYPFDVLKIDRTFIRDLESDPEDLALVTAAIGMSKGLGLSIVAEGVETQWQLDMLADMQCDKVQGFFISKPLTADEFWEWAQKHY